MFKSIPKRLYCVVYCTNYEFIPIMKALINPAHNAAYFIWEFQSGNPDKFALHDGMFNDAA